MKSIISALLLSLCLSACAGLADSSRGSTSQQDGARNAARDYPYNPAY